MKNKLYLLLWGIGLFFTACEDEVSFEPQLSVSPSVLSVFESVGGEQNLAIQTNMEWTASSSSDWIVINPVSGNSETKSILVSALPNETYDGREGTIIFRNSEYNVADTVYFSQVQKDAIIMAQSVYEISYTGGELKFQVSSNVDYTITLPSWIKNVESRGLAEHELVFNVAENEELEARTGEISFKYGAIEQKVEVKQGGYEDMIERNALIALYQATAGDNWTNNTNWCTDKPLNEWYGINTDDKLRVVSVSLCGNNLNGVLPVELGNLAKLKFLRLSENDLSGSIPSALGYLSNLEDLYLDFTALTGSIPKELGNLSKLKTLCLYYIGYKGGLTGEIPKELGNLSDLENFWAQGNKLSGPIPIELGNLTKLKGLDLSYSNLSGSIPAELGKLSELQSLRLSGNSLSGTIPVELGLLTKLRDLSLFGNELSGMIPEELGELKDLEIFWLNDNQLTGQIPVFIGQMKSYEGVSLYNNSLEGDILEDIINHKDWNIYWPKLVSGTNVNMEKVAVKAPEFEVVDMSGSRIISDELYSKNEMTLLFGWRWTDRSYISTLNELFQTYCSKGLDILSCYISGAVVSEQELNDYIRQNIPWNNFIVSYKDETTGTEDNYIKQFSLMSINAPCWIVVDKNKQVIFQSFTEDWNELSSFLSDYFN